MGFGGGDKGKAPYCNGRTGQVELWKGNRVWINLQERVLSREVTIDLISREELFIANVSEDPGLRIWGLVDRQTLWSKG